MVSVISNFSGKSIKPLGVNPTKWSNTKTAFTTHYMIVNYIHWKVQQEFANLSKSIGLKIWTLWTIWTLYRIWTLKIVIAKLTRNYWPIKVTQRSYFFEFNILSLCEGIVKVAYSSKHNSHFNAVTNCLVLPCRSDQLIYRNISSVFSQPNLMELLAMLFFERTRIWNLKIIKNPPRTWT